MDTPTFSSPAEPKPTPSPAISSSSERSPKPQLGIEVTTQEVKENKVPKHQTGNKVIDQTWEKGKKHLLDSLENISGTVRKVSDELRQSKNDGLAQYTETLAEKTDVLYEYFQDKETGALLKDSERYARKNPEIFLAGAFLLGFIGARFLKSQPESEHETMASV